MTHKEEKVLVDEEAVRQSIEKTLKDIKEAEDPVELNRYRRLVKRHVPVFLRSYFTAYLFKRNLEKLPKGPDKFTTLFVSVGKSRRVYPKDLIELFVKNLGMSRSDIGDIKVLENYSFVDVALDYASTAMSKLSGFNYRGRQITVNLARKKGDNRS